MAIPLFPTFRPLDLTDRLPLEAYLRRHPPQASEYSFTNLFIWRFAGGYQIARFRDGYLIRKTSEGQTAFLQPLVPANPAEAVMTCFDYLRDAGEAPLIERVGEDFLAAGVWDPARVAIHEDRDNFDYVYSIAELIALTGEKYHTKKNLMHQFAGKYQPQYRPLRVEMADACLAFAHAWCEERRCEESPGLRQEQCAIVQLLTHFAALSAVGGVLEVEGRLAAFTLGEPLNDDTFVIHVEKADTALVGAYQTINREFLNHATGGYAFVNREQDLGVPGLRKAKLSYHPVRLVKKYRLTGIA